MDLDTNKYKIYHYLNNLWSKKYFNLIPPQSSYLTNVKKKSDNQNTLLGEYKCLLELFNSEIHYDKFVKLFKNNLNLIRKIGYAKNYTNYFDIQNNNLKSEGDEKNNINVIIELITDEDIKLIFNYLQSPIEIKKIIIKKYSKSNIIPKNKSSSDDLANPENYRYYTNHHNIIKIIDRLWCIKLISYFNEYPIDNEIFKSKLIEQDFSQIRNLATINTCKLENKVILDISRAYDSVDWDILYRLVYSNLSNKLGKKFSKEIIDEYMILLTNRITYYDNIIINKSLGIPLGLPSSNIIFHFMMEEIILRWLNNNKNYVNYFILNIFVDDIYFEFNELITVVEINYLIINFMNYLNKFGFNINREKIKISHNIYTKKIGNMLLETDLYLGIPFTRNIHTYGQIILNKFNDRYYSNLTWLNIYNYILTNAKCSNSLLSFFCFKLKPIVGGNINKNILLEFIKINYL
jgi:hypothetical protein